MTAIIVPRFLGQIALAVVVCTGLPSAPASAASASPEPATRRALLIGISRYAPGTGWPAVHAEEDLGAMREILTREGFGQIRELRGRDATRAGIVKAIEDHLIEPAGPGDVAVLHFSGHGQQVADDGEDELDGYDETLVPFDAPARPEGPYGGEKHLRDDELDRLIQRIRRRVGPMGHVLVTLDSCFSGTPRGALAEEAAAGSDGAVVRGGPPIGAPSRRGPVAKPVPGVLEALETGPGTYSSPDLAPYVVLSAARHDQLARETVGPAGRLMGSLTYALARVLPELGAEGTYRLWYERTLRLMELRVSHQPQAEGHLDTLLFGGDPVPQEPFLAVDRAAQESTWLRLPLGTIVGLHPGTRIEVHEEGARRREPATLLATGRVTAAEPASARVDLDAPIDPSRLVRGRVFITHPNHGELRLPVRLAVGEPRTREHLVRLLAGREGALQRVDRGEELILRVSGRGSRQRLELQLASGERLFPTFSPEDPGFEHRLLSRLVEIARSRYLRNLRLSHPEVAATVEIVPVGTSAGGGRTGSGTDRAMIELRATPTGSPRLTTLRIGDRFRIRVTNPGPHPLYLNILNLRPDGTVKALWPNPLFGDRTPLPPGRSMDLPATFEETGPPGEEALLAVASRSWIDLRPFLSPGSDKGPPPPDLEPAPALAGAVSTYTIPLRVIP
jgi:hypothetical protein